MQKKSHNKKRHRWTGKPRPGLPSSSGGNFPPMSGEGECEFTKSYEKKYLKKRLFGILFGILYMQATGQQRSLVNL